jgi:dienelactone hydrolase
VIHENRGLNPHIEDITRSPVDGFVAFARCALPVGRLPGDEDKARELFPAEQPKTREDFVAAAAFLKGGQRPMARSAVGFCYGGGMVNYLATQLPDMAAGVAFYGSSPNVDDVPKIKAALVIQSAEVDERINASWPAYEAALKAANVRYERHLYPGTQHGFNNDTTPRSTPRPPSGVGAYDRVLPGTCASPGALQGPGAGCLGAVLRPGGRTGAAPRPRRGTRLSGRALPHERAVRTRAAPATRGRLPHSS